MNGFDALIKVKGMPTLEDLATMFIVLDGGNRD